MGLESLLFSALNNNRFKGMPVMQFHKILATSFGVVLSTFAHASTFNVLMDVELKSRTVSNGLSGDTVQTIPSQHVDLTLVFDESGAVIYQAPASDPTGLFHLVGTVSATPYTPSFVARLPGPDVPPLDHFDGISYTRFVSVGAPEGLLQTVGVSVIASSGANWQTLGEVSTSTSYSKGVFFDWWVDETATANLSGWTGGEFASYLHSLEGITFSDAFVEDYQHTVRKGAYVDGHWVQSSDSNDLISQEREIITGNVTIQSVSAVPEPSAFLLTGVGLFGVLLAWGRRQST